MFIRATVRFIIDGNRTNQAGKLHVCARPNAVRVLYRDRLGIGGGRDAGRVGVLLFSFRAAS